MLHPSPIRSKQGTLVFIPITLLKACIFSISIGEFLLLGGISTASADPLAPVIRTIASNVSSDFGRWKYTTTRTVMPPGGAFSRIFALSLDTDLVPATDMSLLTPTKDSPLTYIKNQAYTTAATSRGEDPLTGYIAKAQTKATTTDLNPGSVTWSAAGTALSLTKTDNGVPTLNEIAAARWAVVDPVVFEAAPGDNLQVTYQPGSDWSFVLVPPAAGDVPYIATMESDGEAPNPLGGPDLFDWTIDVSSATPGTVTADVERLGAEDTSAESAIKGCYSYNSETKTYNFDCTNFSLSQGFTLPMNFPSSTISVTTEYGELADVTTVPEPSTGLLLGTSFIGLFGYVWRRRKRTTCWRTT